MSLKAQDAKKVLLVEDSKFYGKIVEDLLLEGGYVATRVASGKEAIEVIRKDKTIDIVLMDIVLEGELNGIETARRITEIRDVPIVFLTATSDEATLEAIKSVKAYGYVPKGSEHAALLSNIDMSLKLHEANIKIQEREATLSAIVNTAKDAIFMLDSKGEVMFWNPAAEVIFGYKKEEIMGKKFPLFLMPEKVRDTVTGKDVELCDLLQFEKTSGYQFEVEFKRKSGEVVYVEVSFSPIEIRKGTYTVAIGRDVTKHKQFERELFVLSVTDPLTGAYNRRYTVKKMEEEFERARRGFNVFSVIMLDIDRFKKVNDNFGHDVGDLVLRKLVNNIMERIRKIDTLGRWGGEEFLIILPGANINDAVLLAEELRRSINQMEIPKVGHVSVSLGVATYKMGDSVDSLVKRADEMLYKAKAEGRNCVRYTIEEDSLTSMVNSN